MEMKNVVIHLHLEYASHRRRLQGIFNQLGASSNWSFRIVGDESELIRLIRDDMPPDGIISCPIDAPESLRIIARSAIPFVGIGINSVLRIRRKTNVAFVQNDNEQIGREAAEYFLSRGLFRSYAYVSTPTNEDWCLVRGVEFERRLAQAGHVCRRVVSSQNENALACFLSDLSKPAAVFTACDDLAADVIRVARARKIKVPAELAVLGVDNDELLCEHTTPTLSSVNPDTESTGAAATTALKQLIGHRHTQPITVKCPICGIVERGSTTYIAPETALIMRARAFIRQDSTLTLTPDDIARHLHVSRRLLDLRFHQREKTSVAEILATKRLERAKFLLQRTNRPVKTIFAQAGFRSNAYATRLFKKATGMTPLAWRRTKN